MQTATPVAHQFLETRLPQPQNHLASPLLFFLNAFKAGDATSWLGPNATDALRKMGKETLIAKLTEAFATGGTKASDSVVGEWKTWPLPLYMDGKWETARLYVHNDGQKKTEKGSVNRDKNAVRFLIDVRFTRLGDVQIDGYARTKQLEMIVRSEHPLPEHLRDDLRISYAHTLESIGFAGILSFQTGRDHWLSIQPPHTEKTMLT